MSYLLKPNGIKVPLDGDEFSVDELQDLVDGYIGVESVEDGFVVFDEDAAYKCRYLNIEATKMVLEYKRSINAKEAEEWGGFISGDAVVCKRIKVG